MRPKVGIVGNGKVGSALRRGLERVGYPVRAVGKEPAKVHETGSWAEVIVLAVPYAAFPDALAELGDAVTGKALIDVCNPLTPEMEPALGFDTSAAEQLQKRAPDGKVVKAFNTVFAEHMETGRLRDQPLTAFAAGENAEAKAQVLQLARDIGFDAVDSGPLRNARLLEALGYLNIQLGHAQKLGRQIGFKLLR
jgi:predicted dinucleotide-binding enzyme